MSVEIPAGANSIQIRVRAKDTNGQWGDYRTGTESQVLLAPTITVPIIVMQAQPITVNWTSITGASSYTLQRQADTDEDWTQVYSGDNLTFTESAGAWTSVQYRVQAVFDATPGGWATSETIPVIASSTLAISGQDEDLGTITSDIPYSVATDTGNQISLTRTVNGALVASLTVDGGFAYSIPVMDLPTGTGTIVITATVQTDSYPVTVKRTWTYTKAAQTFPNSGGVAQLSKDGENVFPMTLAEAVKAIGGPWGGNLSTALDKLALAATYSKTPIPKYTEVKVDLSKVQAGDIVNLPENGVMVPFYVASLDYEPTLNAGGTRVLLVRKDVYQNGQWNSTNVNTYANSTIDTWFNNTYKPMLDSKVLAEIGETTFYYTPGNGSNEVTTLARAVFAVSITEIGYGYYTSIPPTMNKEGTELPIASTLKIAYFNGDAVICWTRSPEITRTDVSWGHWSGRVNATCKDPYGYRPCFTLPATFQATYYVDQSGTVHPKQEYTTAGDFADLWGNIIPTVKIETGSYVGTGTYGEGNPNTLTFSAPPKLVFVYASNYGPFVYSGIFIINQKMKEGFQEDGYLAIDHSTISNANTYSKIDGNTLHWYASTLAAQLNGTTYEYIAFLY